MASRERRYLRRPPFGDREPAVEEQNGFAAAKTLVEDADIAGGNPPGALAAREDGPDGERHEGMNPGLAGLERPDGIHLEPGSNSHDLRILHSRMMSSGWGSGTPALPAAGKYLFRLLDHPVQQL